MSYSLSPLCQTFVESMNSFDSGPFMACFAEDATVKDEEHTHRGHPEIQAWIEAAFASYRPTIEVKSVTSNEEDTVIIGNVSGSFEGSPVALAYHLQIRDDKIQFLRCIPV